MSKHECKIDNCRKWKRKIIGWSLIGVLLLVFMGVMSYYCVEYVRYMNKVKTKFMHRIDRLELNQQETYAIITKIIFSVNNVSRAIEKHDEQNQSQFSYLLSLNTVTGNSKRKRRNADASGSAESNDETNSNKNPNSEETKTQPSTITLQRTIHNFRTELFSLNDRLRLLIRNGDKSSLKGEPGKRGAPGKVGPPGTPGLNGRDGYHGNRGEPGVQGPPGPVGPKGPPGKDGLNGINGIPGLHGYKGDQGQKGKNGNDGRDGLNGNTGPIGRTGAPGRQGLQGQKGEKGECLLDFSTQTKEKKSEEAKKQGVHVVYTMWGSSNCPSSSKTIYSGHVGMSKFELNDGQITGSNIICMPVPKHKRQKRDILPMSRESGLMSDPGITFRNGTGNSNNTSQQYFNKTEDKSPTTETPITTTSNVVTKISTNSQDKENDAVIETKYSTLDSTTVDETITFSIETKTTPDFISSTSIPTTSGYRFVPKYSDLVGTRNYLRCSVCDAVERSDKVMLPGKTDCPNNWSIEYQGYLMNYHHGTVQANIVCVNDQALGISPSSDAGIREIISTYLSHVKTDCSTFPCPPLNRGELLKCVVCSK